MYNALNLPKNSCCHGNLGGAQVGVHAVVLGGDELDVVVGESVYLQLECQSRLQVTIDWVFLKLHTEKELILAGWLQRSKKELISVAHIVMAL